MRSDTELVNTILSRHLLGACVESYGLSHQVLTLTFRDDATDDHTLWIETEVYSSCQDYAGLSLDANGQALLLFNRVNLQAVTDIACDDESTLKIRFANGVELNFNGTPADTTVVEPWHLGNEGGLGSYNIIAMHGGGYAVFGDSISSTT